MVVVGQGIGENTRRLFGKLRPRGMYYSNVSPQDGLRTLMERAGARARSHPAPFAHWYIDGGVPATPAPAGTELLAYSQLEPIRTAVVSKLRGMIAAGAGTEAKRSALMRLSPEDVGLKGEGQERVRNHFRVTVLSEGSGVQFFSTTFVQWAAREVLLEVGQPMDDRMGIPRFERVRTHRQILGGCGTGG